MPLIRPIEKEDYYNIERFLIEHWGDVTMWTRGICHNVLSLPGFITYQDSKIIGLLTFYEQEKDIEIISLNAIPPLHGLGSALLTRLYEYARTHHCQRLWLITTNDNLNALRFYQRRGFQITNIFNNQISSYRIQKPSIPLIGENGIPLRDEIMLEAINL